MVRKVITPKEPSLRAKSKVVKKLDKKVLDLIADMKDTLKAQKDPEGVGLAAPQIGKNLRIFLIDYEGTQKVIINPEIVSKSTSQTISKSKKNKSNDILEGCLSLPHFYGPLVRSEKVKIKYKTEEGKDVEEEFVGFLAQIVQHEIDHLNGILFVDRILEQKAPLYKFNKNGEWEDVKLD